jgi:membrane protein DedA with SNARE-associated domain
VFIINIIHIAILCIIFGGLSIPLSFHVTDSFFAVWAGNALGSFLSAAVVIYVGDRITDKKEEEKLSKRRLTKKIVNVFEKGDENKKIKKARIIINKHGLRFFSLFCPLFPGVLLSTVAVYALDLDKKIYKKWMFAGVVLISGVYVFLYWHTFVKT